ncbi:MAG: hypothetical protein K2X43_01145 [Hyphomonadaceae bacterium]|jgi:phage repressor protein C with HTH and peptisase S24 domain|nr:hypothetical protein [Hyphomonadaceae bacterium]
MGEQNLNPTTLSRKAKLGQTAVRDLLEKQGQPRLKTMRALAMALGVTVSELADGDGTLHQKVLVIGQTSDRDSWTPKAEKVEEIELRLDAGEPVAVRVRGNQYSPIYKDGDLLIGSKRTPSEAQHLIGSDCIILTDDGHHLLRYLARGSGRGRFTLRPHDPSEEELRDVKLSWVAPIQIIRRAPR